MICSRWPSAYLPTCVGCRDCDCTGHAASRPTTAETHARLAGPDSGQDAVASTGWKQALELAQDGRRDRRWQRADPTSVEGIRSETASDGALPGQQRPEV